MTASTMAGFVFYSEQARQECGGVNEYELQDGSKALGTSVCRDSQGSGYHWDDKQLMGPVKRWLRTVQRSRFPYYVSYSTFRPDGTVEYFYGLESE
jgi:hypothetical protein